jgi:hypothetical protein
MTLCYRPYKNTVFTDSIGTAGNLPIAIVSNTITTTADPVFVQLTGSPYVPTFRPTLRLVKFISVYLNWTII